MTQKEKPHSWKNIWEKKGEKGINSIELSDLIAMDGFDTNVGKFSVDRWLSFVHEIRERLNIKNKLLEVGCGCGAFLYPLTNFDIEIYGIDYSENLVKICSEAIPSGVFKTAEANQIPFKDQFFDSIISHGVFIYFESLDYAQEVLSEMVRMLKNTGNIAILDINDADKKQECETIKREKLGDDEYERLYGNLNHQFYPKKWFEEIVTRFGLQCEIQDQNIQGYENSKFRYNVFLSYPK